MSELRNFEGKLPKAVREFLEHNRILDAHIIRGTCPTCGGSRKCQRCDGEGKWFYELELMMIDCEDCGGTGACPDCADVPVWVIAPEAREAMVVAVRLELTRAGITAPLDIAKGCPLDKLDFAIADAVLQALLPGARRAKEVVVVDSAGTMTIPVRDIDGESRYEDFVEGDTIAILHNEQEKEHV